MDAPRPSAREHFGVRSPRWYPSSNTITFRVIPLANSFQAVKKTSRFFGPNLWQRSTPLRHRPAVFTVPGRLMGLLTSVLSPLAALSMSLAVGAGVGAGVPCGWGCANLTGLCPRCRSPVSSPTGLCGDTSSPSSTDGSPPVSKRCCHVSQLARALSSLSRDSFIGHLRECTRAAFVGVQRASLDRCSPTFPGREAPPGSMPVGINRRRGSDIDWPNVLAPRCARPASPSKDRVGEPSSLSSAIGGTGTPLPESLKLPSSLWSPSPDTARSQLRDGCLP